jgi:uncharacterized glyoxalase superfamily protein PhnB
VQRIVPYLVYQDAPAAIEFLCKAFGFTERFRYDDKDGRIGHAELELLGDTLMLASVYEGFGDSPLNLPTVSASVYCVVDDLDAHFQRARDAGATIVAEPEDDHGRRMYRAMDPEGQRFLFSTKGAA